MKYILLVLCIVCLAMKASLAGPLYIETVSQSVCCTLYQNRSADSGLLIKIVNLNDHSMYIPAQDGNHGFSLGCDEFNNLLITNSVYKMVYRSKKYSFSSNLTIEEIPSNDSLKMVFPKICVPALRSINIEMDFLSIKPPDFPISVNNFLSSSSYLSIYSKLKKAFYEE